MQVEIFGVPMDLGANLRGVDMGPSALRIAGIGSKIEALGHEVLDRGEVDLRSRVTLPKDESSAKYIDEIVEVCSRLHDVAKDAKDRGSLPVFLGGDHSIAAGTIAGVAS
ncbi:MAG: arginase, partial [Planctomycetota bacterium]